MEMANQDRIVMILFPVVIETPRLILREFQESDWPDN